MRYIHRMEVFSVLATMTLMDALSAPLRAVRASMKATDSASASLGYRMGQLAMRLAPLAFAARVLFDLLAQCVSTVADFEAQMSRVGATSHAMGGYGL